MRAGVMYEIVNIGHSMGDGMAMGKQPLKYKKCLIEFELMEELGQ